MPKYANQEIIRKLVAFGHCMAKTCEIALDYARGDKHAIAWVRMVERTGK